MSKIDALRNQTSTPSERREITDETQLQLRMERFERTMTHHAIQAEVDQRRSHPGQNPDKAKYQLEGNISEINCGNRPIYNFSDLHLDTDPNWISGPILEKINNILLAAIGNNGIVIFNGDMFEGWHNTVDGTKRLTTIFERVNGKYKNQSNNAKNFRNFVRLMRDPRIDTIVLQGNHDPQSWYNNGPGITRGNGELRRNGGELQNMLGCFMATHVILNQNEKRTFVSHGHQLFVDADEINMGTSDQDPNQTRGERPGFQRLYRNNQNQEAIGKVLTRLEWLTASTNYFTRQMLNGQNDQQFLEVLPSWITALERATGHQIDTVSLGHSHLGGNYQLQLPDGRNIQVGVTGSGKGGLHGELEYATIENGTWVSNTLRDNREYGAMTRRTYLGNRR